MLHLHSFIKWKYNHTRSTHCSALLKMLINEPSHANGFFKKEKKNNWKTNSQINHKTHFFKTCMCYTVKCCFIGGNRDIRRKICTHRKMICKWKQHAALHQH